MASTFIVYPMSQKIFLKAGEVFHGSINIAVPKAATEDFKYKISVYPYSVSGEDYDVNLETVSGWNEILEWIRIEDTDGVLAPNEVKKIDFTIAVPADAPAGGQYLAIGVGSDSAAEASDGTVKDSFEMASLVYAEIDGETIHDGEVLENYLPGFVTSAPVTTVAFSNHGNVHETAKVSLKIKNILTGEELKLTDDAENTYESVIMPMSTRRVVRQLNDLPMIGVFEVTQDVDYIGQTSSFVTVMAICPIWFMVLVIVLIGGIIGATGGLIYSKHKKRLRAKE